MKKFLIAAVCTAVCAVCAAAAPNAAERYSDRRSRDAVRAVAELGSVECAAVLSRDGEILAGIILEEGTNDEARSAAVLNAERVLAVKFPFAHSVFAEADSDLAFDIIELSFFLDSDMDKKILSRRFDTLAKRAKI